MALDGALARGCIGTEPGSVSGRAARDARKVRVGIVGICLGVGYGGVELRLLGGRAADEAGPLIVDTGDSEITREFNLGSVFNGGEQTLEGAIGIDVDEEVRWLDGIVSSASSGEVVRTRD